MHRTTLTFWGKYNSLPEEIRKLADKNFQILKNNPEHPSLQLKQIDELWSIRAGIHYRALGIDDPEQKNAILWFWIGSHAEYDKLVADK